jgi:hypothetical protein
MPLEFTGEDIELQTTDSRGKLRRPIMLSDIYNALANAKTAHDIMAQDPRVELATINLARAFLFALAPQLHEEICRLRPRANYPVLTDENLPSSLPESLSGVFKNVTSVRAEGLKGQSDRQILKWMVNNYRALITRDKNNHRPDRDLVCVGEEMALDIIHAKGLAHLDEITLNDLPLLVIIAPDVKKEDVPRRLAECSNEIYRHLEIRNHLNIIISATNVRPGQSYTGILEKYKTRQEERKQHERYKSGWRPSDPVEMRIRAYAKKWMKVIVDQKKDAPFSKETLEEIADRIYESALSLLTSPGREGQARERTRNNKSRCPSVFK